MSCYSKVIKALDLNRESQGTGYDLVYLLLKVADVYETANPTEDEFENPFKEVLRRLRLITNEPDGHGIRNIADKVFGSRVHACKPPWRSA